jgi:hypothetical protein
MKSDLCTTFFAQFIHNSDALGETYAYKTRTYESYI